MPQNELQTIFDNPDYKTKVLEQSKQFNTDKPELNIAKTTGTLALTSILGIIGGIGAVKLMTPAPFYNGVYLA